MSKVVIENDEIYYSQIGDAKAEKSLVFIPGSGMTETLMSVFSKNFFEYNTITIDLPGHGQSRGSIKESIAEITKCVEEVIRQLYNEKVLTEDITILGYSLGGFVAISLGLIDLPQIKRIVAISSCADLSQNPLGKTMAEATEVIPEQIYSALCGSKTKIQKRDQEIAKMFLDDLEEANILFKDLYLCAPFNVKQQLGNIKKPMLIVIGDEDQIIRVKDAKETASLIENAKFIQYNGFGHGMLYENMEQVVVDIKAFIQ